MDIVLPLTVKRIDQEELMMIIIISAVVVAILLLASIVTCVYCVKKSAANKGENSTRRGKDIKSYSVCHFETNWAFFARQYIC